MNSHADIYESCPSDSGSQFDFLAQISDCSSASVYAKVPQARRTVGLRRHGPKLFDGL